MSTRAEIQSEVLRIVEAATDRLAAAIPSHIQRAQRAIEDRCVFRIQDAEVTVKVTPGALTYEKPADFISMREPPYYLRSIAISAELNGVQAQRSFLEQVESFQVFGNKNHQAPPKYWRDETEVAWGFWPRGDNLGPGSSPAGSYEIVMPYHKRLAKLSLDSSSNFWTEQMEDVLAWKAAAFVFADLRDPAAQFWNTLSDARFNQIKAQYKRNRMRISGSSIYPSSSLSSRSENARRPYRLPMAEIPKP